MYRTGSVDRITHASGHNPPGIFRNSSEVPRKIKMNEFSTCCAYFMFKILEEYEVVQRESKKKKTFNKKLNLTYRIAYITRKAVKIAV